MAYYGKMNKGSEGSHGDYMSGMKPGRKGAAYMGGNVSNRNDPSCPSSGYVYGHSNYGGGSPSEKQIKG